MLPVLRTRFHGLALIVAAALVLRLAVIGAQAGRPLSGDELSYDDIALNVATGHGYQVGHTDAERRPTAVRGPGYVLMLAACYKTFGHQPTVPLVVQALMDALSVVLIARLARRWFGSPVVPLVAAGFYALYPPFILSAASLLTETITHLTILLTVVLFFDYLARRRARDLLASATALGVCALSKPQLAPVGIVLCVAAIPQLGFAGAVRGAVIVVAVTALVLSPWIVRNEVVFHRFIPGVTLGGMGLWFGAGPVEGRTIGGLDAPGVPDSLRALVSGMSELEANRWGAQQALRIIVADPGHYARLSVKKFFRLWFNLGFDGVRPSRASVWVALFNLAVIALAAGGARAAAPTPPAATFMALLALFWTAVNLPFFTVVRYAYPYYALLFVFAAAGIVATLGTPPAEGPQLPETPEQQHMARDDQRHQERGQQT